MSKASSAQRTDLSGITPAEIRALAPRIRLLKPRLSDREQVIVDYLLQLGPGIEQVTLPTIASQHGVSQAMVVKLCHKLGYSGFRSLRKVLTVYSRSQDIAPHEEIDPSDSAQVVVQKIFQTSIRALQDTLAIFDIPEFEKAVDAMADARLREFYGVGGSGAIVIDAYHKFLRIGIRTAAYTDAHLMLMSASLLDGRDVVLAVSHSGRTEVLIDAVRLARERGARTIALTNYLASPLAETAEIVLCSTAQGSPLTGENAAARIVQLNILDALFVAVAQRNYAQAMLGLDQTRAAVVKRKL